VHEMMRSLVYYVCLLYHEARNVRHPIKRGLVPYPGKYSRLLNLAGNPNEAWQQMASTRESAFKASSAGAITRLFEEMYGLTLSDLFALYKEGFWRHARLYGGNAWAPITAQVMDLAASLADQDGPRPSALVNEISAMCHNTGTVQSKLERLEMSS